MQAWSVANGAHFHGRLPGVLNLMFTIEIPSASQAIVTASPCPETFL